MVVSLLECLGSKDSLPYGFTRWIPARRDASLSTCNRLESGMAPLALLEGPEQQASPRVSPNGRFIAYISNESGRDELYVRRFPSGEGKWQIFAEGASNPCWSADGDELFYLRNRDLMATALSTEASFTSTEPMKLFTLASPSFYEYAVTQEGQFVVVVPGEETSTIAVVDHWQSFFAAANK
jgi:dipeptidyl aminopeptidase/acylaminoacyl peptidase